MLPLKPAATGCTTVCDVLPIGKPDQPGPPTRSVTGSGEKDGIVHDMDSELVLMSYRDRGRHTLRASLSGNVVEGRMS